MCKVFFPRLCRISSGKGIKEKTELFGAETSVPYPPKQQLLLIEFGLS